jgi:hypothetical protein
MTSMRLSLGVRRPAFKRFSKGCTSKFTTGRAGVYPPPARFPSGASHWNVRIGADTHIASTIVNAAGAWAEGPA